MKNLRLQEKLVEAFKICLDNSNLEDLTVGSTCIQLELENYDDGTKKDKFLVEAFKNEFTIKFGTLKCDIMSNVYNECLKLAEKKREKLKQDLIDSDMFKIDQIIGANEHIWENNNNAIEE